MTNKKYIIKNCAILGLFFVSAFSCKLPADPKAIVTVVDEDGVALRDALVVLDCTPAQNTANTQVCVDGLLQEDNSNKDGKVEFETTLPCVLKASAIYVQAAGLSTDTLKGDAFIEFKEGEVTEGKIIVYP